MTKYLTRHNSQRCQELLHLSRSLCPKDKEKQKEIWFDKFLKKNPSQVLNALFFFDILVQLANIPARITLLCLSKEMCEVLRDALANSESFLSQVPSIPTDDNGLLVPNSYGTTTSTMHHLHFRGHTIQRQLVWLTFVLLRVYWVYTPWEDISRSRVYFKHHPPKAPLFSRHPTEQVIDHDYDHIWLHRWE